MGNGTVTVTGGVATFTGLGDETAEATTLVFAATGPDLDDDGDDHRQPGGRLAMGDPHAPLDDGDGRPGVPHAQPVVYEEDQYGNLISTDSTTQVTVSLGSGTGPLQGTKSVIVSGGMAPFAGLFDEMAETITLSFSGGGLTAATSLPDRRQTGDRDEAGRADATDFDGDGRSGVPHPAPGLRGVTSSATSSRATMPRR